MTIGKGRHPCQVIWPWEPQATRNWPGVPAKFWGANWRRWASMSIMHPCCDVNINPENPAVGIRSFGEDPKIVGELASAMVTGIQSAGVAATTKTFSGTWRCCGRFHIMDYRACRTHSDRLRQVEFPPFASAIQAGSKMVMTAHLALPAIDGPDAPPATLSPTILKGLLRNELGFEGVIVTDAMDMHAIGQGRSSRHECRPRCCCRSRLYC